MSKHEAIVEAVGEQEAERLIIQDMGTVDAVHEHLVSIGSIEECRFLLVKRGLFYRPNSQGYTGIKEFAGRYHEADARPECGVTAIHEDKAPDYASACATDVMAAHLSARIANVAARTEAAFREGWRINAIPAEEHEAGAAYVQGCETADWLASEARKALPPGPISSVLTPG